MAEIRIITESLFAKRTYLDEIDREVITVDQLVEKINSAMIPGPPREYILRQ